MNVQAWFDEGMKLETKEEAGLWLDGWIKEAQQENPSLTYAEAKKIQLQNLGYIAGYYGSTEAHKVHELFGAVHPIFGTHTYYEDLTPEEAFETGKKWGETAQMREILWESSKRIVQWRRLMDSVQEELLAKDGSVPLDFLAARSEIEQVSKNMSEMREMLDSQEKDP